MKDYGYYCEHWLYRVSRSEAGDFRLWLKRTSFCNFGERRVTGCYPFYVVD